MQLFSKGRSRVGALPSKGSTRGISGCIPYVMHPKPSRRKLPEDDLVEFSALRPGILFCGKIGNQVKIASDANYFMKYCRI